MNDDSYRCSHKNSAEYTKVPKATAEGTAEGTTDGTTKVWLRNFNPRSYAMCFIICIIIIVIVFIIYWRYIRPKWYKKFYKKLLQFEGFKYSQLTNQEGGEDNGEASQLTQPVSYTATHTNCHVLIYGNSASGKTSFLKHYLTQIQRSYVVSERDESEFPAFNFVHLLQLEKTGIAELCETLANKMLYWMMQVHTKVLKQKWRISLGLMTLWDSSDIPCSICKGCSPCCKRELFQNIHNN